MKHPGRPPGVRSLYSPWQDLPDPVRHKLLFGTSEKIEFTLDKGERKHYFKRRWEGFVNNLERLYHETNSQGRREELSRFMNSQPCTSCNGSRLRDTSLAIKVGGINMCGADQVFGAGGQPVLQ